MVQIAGRQFSQFCRERRGWCIRLVAEGVVVRQLTELRHRGIGQTLFAEAQSRALQARHGFDIGVTPRSSKTRMPSPLVMTKGPVSRCSARLV